MSYKAGDKILVELTVGSVQTRTDGEKEYFIATDDVETDKGMWIDETDLSYIVKGCEEDG